MRRRADLLVASFLIVAGVALLAHHASAQEEKPAVTTVARAEKPAVTYKLDFTLSELEDGTRVNSRSYSMLMEEGDWGRTRIGTRVPINLGEGKGIQYMDVGFSLDARVKQREGDLRLEVRLEANSFAPVEQGEAPRPREPVLRSMRSELTASVIPGKPTLLTTVDELGSKRRFQLEVTATRPR
jgi:hypothetical protein